MKTDREFIGSVYEKIAEYGKNYRVPFKRKPGFGILSVTATAVCVVFAAILIPGLLNPVFKDSAVSGAAGTGSEAAETEKSPTDRFEGLSPDELCEKYDLKYDVFYPDYYIKTEDLNGGERIPVSGTGLKIAALSEWTFGNTFGTTVNVDHLFYKLTPVQISLTEKSNILSTITDLLGMMYGSEPDIITERMKSSTVYYCVKFPDGPPTGELTDTQLEEYYSRVTAYFFCEHESGWLLRFLLVTDKEKFETDITRCLAMCSTAEITEGNPYHFGIDLPLDTYTLSMSSVPGLPFTINIPEGTEVYLDIAATYGTVMTWEDTYEVKPFVNGAKYSRPVTLYWSPVTGDGTAESLFPAVKEGDENFILITVTVYTSDKQEGKREIQITPNGVYYSAHAGRFIYTG